MKDFVMLAGKRIAVKAWEYKGYIGCFVAGFSLGVWKF